MNRRSFIFGGMALIASSGCRSTNSFFRSPRLRFGVISDVHLSDEESALRLERALGNLRRCNVDAVMVCGDLTDWGILPSFRRFAAAWRKVFGGSGVRPLFITGNHDLDGWRYADMAIEMHALGFSERDRSQKHGGIGRVWQEVFGEEWAPIRLREVKGYQFLSAEWDSPRDLEAWLAENEGLIDRSRPLFYFQHAPIPTTTGDTRTRPLWDKTDVRSVLKRFPNAIAFTGHTHVPFTDERQIWQDEFTVIGTPSLSYASTHGDCDNGYDRHDQHSDKVMPNLPTRLLRRGGQGYLVDVFDDEIVVGRMEFEEGFGSAADDWTLPQPFESATAPYRADAQYARSPVPRFPADAEVATFFRNVDTRNNRYGVAMMLEFPSASVPARERVFTYEVTAQLEDGSEMPMARFFAPLFAWPASHEPDVQSFRFNATRLPQGIRYRLAVRASTSVGKKSEPIFSVWRKGEPGLEKVDKSDLSK